MSSSVAKERKKLVEAMKGKSSLPVVLRCFLGDFTSEAMGCYAALVRETSLWLSLPEEFRTHQMSLGAYRGSAASAAGTYQLHVVRQRTYPFTPFGLLHGSPDGKLVLATKIEGNIRHTFCLICPGWQLVILLYQTVDELMGVRLSCLALAPHM